MGITETVEALRALRGRMGVVLELEYTDALDWYYDLVHAGNDCIAQYDYEGLAFMETWRRGIKREMVA